MLQSNVVMRLFFDARYIETTSQTGISRYSIELGAAVARRSGSDLDVTFLIHNEIQRQFLPNGASCLRIHAPTSAKEPFTGFILNKYRPDVVFSPMQTMGAAGRRYKLILTLHDLIYYRHRTPPSQFNWLIRLGWRLYHATYIPQRLTLNAADAVATVSNTSRDDILAAKLTKRPVIVTRNAPQNLRQHLKKAPTFATAPNNLVYMGSFMKYKNVETLIKGMELLPSHTLHLLSRISPERQHQYEQLVSKRTNIVFHNGVSDKAYAELLADNALLVSASLDEGYGIPLADAGALGVPAVVTDMPIFHEVAGRGALYFDPRSPEDFIAKVRKASAPATYQKLSKESLAHSRLFSWDASAATLITAARSILDS